MLKFYWLCKHISNVHKLCYILLGKGLITLSFGKPFYFFFLWKKFLLLLRTFIAFENVFWNHFVSFLKLIVSNGGNGLLLGWKWDNREPRKLQIARQINDGKIKTEYLPKFLLAIKEHYTPHIHKNHEHSIFFWNI